MPSKTREGFSRSDGWYVDPNLLVLVTDPNDPLYDARATQPPDERFVLNVMKYGVRLPILAIRRGWETIVLDGRRRVLAAREANRRKAEAGDDLIRVPIKIDLARKPLDQLGVMISSNEIRLDDNPVARAEKMSRFMEVGRSEEDAAITFGISKAEVKRLLALLTLDSKVLKEIERGTISPSAALELVDMTQDKQREAIQKLAEEAPATNRKRKVSMKAAAKAAGKDKVHMPSKKEVQLVLDDEVSTEDYKAGVRWARGL